MTPSLRTRLLVPALGCAAVLAVSSIATSQEAGQEPTAAQTMAARATELLASLDDARAGMARADHEVAERTQWAFGPVQREGLPLGGLGEEQMKALEALLDTALSDAGMVAWREVRAQEIELRRLESKPGKPALHRDPDLYWLRIYGTPDPTKRWSWRFEGHHLALHVDCRPRRTPSVTPFFLGTNPLFVTSESGEESIGVGFFPRINGSYAELCGAIGETVGVTEEPRPSDVRMAPGKDALPPADGVDLGALAPEQRVKVLSLLDAYLGLLDPELRKPYSIDPERASKVHFARWGGAGLREPRAWALVAPRFALELVTTEGPHHVHVLLRDPERDFGGK